MSTSAPPADARDLRRLALISALVVLTHGCAPSSNPPPESPAAGRAALAPGGTLRAGVNLGNPVLAVRDSGANELRGVAVEIARELAARLEVPLQFVTYESASQLAEEAPSGRWDVAFLGVDPAREALVTFSAPYVVLEATYLVPAGSRLRALADVDAPGVRIAARPRSAYDLALRRIIKHAQLVYPAAGQTDVALFTSGKADALASLRDVLADEAASIPGARVLDGQFATIQQAIGVPKGRGGASAYLQDFLVDVKKSGFVADAIRRTGARGASPAP